jgi:hypothetical protein
LNVRRRICQHLEFLTIRLNLVIKNMINRATLIGGTPIGVILINGADRRISTTFYIKVVVAS